MNRAVKNILKILLIGFVTTIVRIVGQLSIPAGQPFSWPPLLSYRLSESLSRINAGFQRFYFLNSPTFSAKNS